MNTLKLLPLVSLLLTLAACTANPKYATIDELVAQGGEIISVKDLIGETGVTFVGTNETWFNYLGADGRKVVKITDSGETKELAWRINDDGQFCQHLFATEKEACDSHVVIKDQNGNYNSYSKEDNKPGYPFTLVAGNPENF